MGGLLLVVVTFIALVVSRKEKKYPYFLAEKGTLVQEKMNWTITSTSSNLHQDQVWHNNSTLPFFYQEYIDFHNQHTKAKFASNNSRKYLIWRCGTTKENEAASCGGTGDRLKGILSAFYTAMCSKRIFLIDWPAAAARGLPEYLEPNHIDWRVPHDFLPARLIPEVGRFRKMHDYSSTVLRTFAIPQQLQNRTVLAMRTNRWYQDELSDGHWYGGKSRDPSEWYPNQSSPCLRERLWRNTSVGQQRAGMQDEHYLFRTAFQILFRFSDKVDLRAREIQRMANLLSNDRSDFIESTATTTKQPYLTVHIRTGVAFHGDPDRHTAEDYAKFYDCAKRLQQEIVLKHQQQCPGNTTRYRIMPIYVASDDVRAKQSLLRMDQERSTADLSIRTLPNLTLYHMDFRDTPTNTNKKDGELTVWAELKVLMEATCLVSSTSGFSHLATWLQGLKKTKSSTDSNHRCAIHFGDCANNALVSRAVDALDDEC